MLTNQEYSQLVTALFYSSDSKTVPLAAVNSLLRIFTNNPGELKIDAENKTLSISETKRPSFFSRLFYFLSLGQR